MPARDSNTKVGISQCLLGDEVRYDGGHKRNFAVDHLGRAFSWVPVCPEVEAGMGVPREPVHLEVSPEGTRMVGNDSGTDQTDLVQGFVVRKMEDLAGADLRGFILKSGSPSCGQSVEVKGGESAPGLFARALSDAFPALPVIEESDLEDSRQLQGFVERVFAFDRMMLFFGGERSVGQLVMAHVQARLQLTAHEPGLHAKVAELFKQGHSYAEIGPLYLREFMEALRTPATPAGHFAVMKSVFDEIRGGVEPPVQKELARSLQDYRQGNVPLSVPLTLLRHYIRVKEHPLFNQQTYFEPAAKELLLRTEI